MQVLISFICAITPAIYLVWYYYKQDRNRPEPKRLVIKIFLLGFISIIPVVIVEIIVERSFYQLLGWHPLMYAAIKAFLVAGLVEEIFKFLVVKKFAYDNDSFDEVTDGIIYMIIASLGFACLENILYVMNRGLFVALLRAFTAVPMHAIMSGIMGYYIGKAKFAIDSVEEKRLIHKGLAIGVLIHGSYNFLLFANPLFGNLIALGIFPLIIITYVNLKRKIKLALAEDISAGRVTEKLNYENVS